jgi:diguanylate cyclase (GGDEF)-like protein
MVKERKKFNTLDLVSKYSLLETGNYQHKINALLNEICDLFDSKWIYVENKLDNKNYSNSEFNISPVELKQYRIQEIKDWGFLYLEKLDENFQADISELAGLIKLIINNIEEQERNNIIFRLTSEIRKSLRPDIAIEKLYLSLKDYLQIKSFCFLQRVENSPKILKANFIMTASEANFEINKGDEFSDDEIFNLEKYALEDKSKFLKVFESKLRNEKFGYFLIDKYSSWTHTQDELIILFVEQIAVILNQHKLNSEVLSIVQREFLLNQITTRIRDSLIVREIIDLAALEVGQIMGADSCGIYLLEKTPITKESKQAIWSSQRKYNSSMEAMLHSSLHTIYHSKFEKISWCYANFDREGINKAIYSFHRDYSVGSFLACALMDHSNKNIIGFILLSSFNSSKDWQDKDVELLESISQQLSLALTQASIYQDSQQTKKQMALLHQLSIDIRNTLEISVVLGSIARGLGEILGVSRCFVRRLAANHKIIKTEEEYTVESVVPCADIIFGFEKRWISSLLTLSNLDKNTEVLNFQTLRNEFRDEGETLLKITDSLQMKSYLSVPLISQGKLLGTITVHQCDREREFSIEEINFILQVGSEAAVAIKNAELFDTIDKMSKTDPDTGLYNKKYFNTVALGEIQAAKANQKSISLMMLDLDYLKSINDNFGHEAGDEAIIIMSEVLSKTLRHTLLNEVQRRVSDLVGRYGGDEFIVLLPNTDLESAYQAATRIRRNLSKSRHSAWNQPLTCSIGIAGIPNDAYDFNQLKIKADQALYLSKKKGRNAISTSREI